MEVVATKNGRGCIAARHLLKGEVVLHEYPIFNCTKRLDLGGAIEAVEKFLNLDSSEQSRILDPFHFGDPEWIKPQSWGITELVQLRTDALICPLPLGAEAITNAIKESICWIHQNSTEKSEEKIINNISLAIRLMLTISLNAHEWGEPNLDKGNKTIRSGGGLALYPLGSIFNHSCNNNMRTRRLNDGSRQWFAGQEIDKGEELFANYIDQASPVLLMGSDQRKDFLLQTKLFICECTMCTYAMDSLPCNKCGAQLIPRNGGKCGCCRNDQSQEECDVLIRGEKRLFHLIASNDIKGLDDANCLALLNSTKEIFGSLHWAVYALALSLLSRDSLCASISDFIPKILSLRQGCRRISDIILVAAETTLSYCVDPRRRHLAMKMVEHVILGLERCIEDRSFRFEQDHFKAVDLLNTLKRTLLYASDPINHDPCCMACAVALQQLDGINLDSENDQKETTEQNEEYDYGISEEYEWQTDDPTILLFSL